MNILEKIKGYDALAAKVSDLEAKAGKVDTLVSENGQLKQAAEEAVNANKDLTAKISEKDQRIAALEKEVKETKTSVETVASHKAAEITAGQGIPPVASTPQSGAVEDPFVAYSNEKDPAKAKKIYDEKIAPIFGKKNK